MNVVRFSASCTGRLYPQEMLLVLIFTRDLVDPRNMSLKNPVSPPGIDPGTVRLIAQRLNHYATPGTTTACYSEQINPLNAGLNPICHLLALLGGATIVVVSRLRVKNDSGAYKVHMDIC